MLVNVAWNATTEREDERKGAVSFFPAYKAELYRALEDYRAAVQDGFFALNSKDEMALYIRQQQVALVSLSNTLCRKSSAGDKSSQNNKTPGTATEGHKQEIAGAVRKALSILQTGYTDYFDEGLPIPQADRAAIRNEGQKKVRKLLAQLEMSCKDAGLNAILRQAAQKLFDSEAPITFGQSAYLNLALERLGGIDINEGEEPADVISDVLFRINFNTRAFAGWYCRRMGGRLAEMEGDDERISALALELKKYRQMMVKPGTGLYPAGRTLHDIITEWIAGEMDFLNCRTGAEGVQPAAALVKESGKIVSSLSVPQIACFIRLMVEAGAITNRNQSEMLRIFAHSLITPRTAAVSAESLRSKYYNLERSAVDATRDLLLRMVNQSRRLMP